MKGLARISCRLIAWAALCVVTLWLIGFCFGVGLWLEGMRRSSNALGFAIGIGISVGMVTVAGLAWRWMFRLARRLP